MLRRLLVTAAALAIVIGVGFWAPELAAGQSGASTFQTPWGAPDLQGIWANDVSTPLQRPSRFAGKAELTDEELAAYTEERQQCA